MARSIGIRIFQGDDLVTTEVFQRDIIKIGRLASAHLRLEDTKVSRIHAVIELSQKDEVSIIDMGSAEGTRVNGEKISRSRLKNGDEVGLGDSRLVIVLDPADIAALTEGPLTAEVKPPVPETTAVVTVEALDKTAPDTAPLTDEAGLGGPLSELPLDSIAPALEPAPATLPPVVTTAPAAAPPSPSPRAPAAGVLPVAPRVPPTPPSLPPIPVDPITPANRYMEVSLRWGGEIVEVVRERDASKVVIGVLDDCQLFVPLEAVGGGETFDLVENVDGSWRLNLLPGMSGHFRGGGIEGPLSSLGGGTGIADDFFATIEIGMLTLEVKPVSKSRVIPIAPFFDTLALNIALVTLSFFAAVVLTLAILPAGLMDDEDSIDENLSAFKTVIMKPPPKDNEFLKRLKQKVASAPNARRAGKKTKRKMKKVEKVALPKAAKNSNEQVVAAKLKALFGDGNSGIAALFGTDSGGGELAAALGSLSGQGSVAGLAGAGGLNIRGTALTGAATGTVGIGRVGTRGRGSGDVAFGAARGGLGKRVEHEIKISQGKPVIMGSLDKEIIRRVVREHMAQIRYCYEKELNRTPGLKGKVVQKWVISASGSVQSATVAQTTMKNKSVETCMSRKIRRWRFPKPKGGGIVIVTYPFIFKQAG